MKRLWNEFLGWLSSRSSFRRIVSAEKKMQKLCRQSKKNNRRLKKNENKLRSIKNLLISIGDSVSDDIEEAKNLNEQYEKSLTAARSELEILKEITIPTMVASHKLLLEQYDAQTAVEVRKKLGPQE